VWRFTIFGVLFFLVLQVSLSFSPSTTQPHCAPVNPPPVSGTLVQPPAISGVLFINEALFSPHANWNCSDANAPNNANDSWIELYNSQNQAFDLYSAHTTLDCGAGTNPFYLPFGSAIAPYGFLVVFPLMGNVSCSSTATWRLLIGGTVVDEVKIPPTELDQSYARIPDGGPSWAVTSIPTIGSSNMGSVVSPTATRTKAEATATARASRNNGGNSYRSGGGSSNGGSGSGGNSDSGSSNGTGTVHGKQIDGIQPTWKSLHHPDLVATAPPTVLQQAGNVFSSVSNDGLDMPHKIFLTLLVLALAFALLWCWRLFRPTT
jgi:hypothetical protein